MNIQAATVRAALGCRLVFWTLSWFAVVCCGMSGAPSVCGQETSPPNPPAEQGRAIYLRQCAACHGAEGQGVEDAGTKKFEGSHQLADLARVIDETMPEDDPESCVGDGAQAVARYVFEHFYAGQAAQRQARARIELSRLTVRQYNQAVADLLATFLGEPQWSDERGLEAAYHNSKGFDRRTRVIERRDPRVSFDFQEASPQEGKIGNEEFAIHWQGSVLADETGDYEFCVETENGMKLWVNDTQVPLIDAWVASGGKQAHRATLRLLGGRLYPIRLDFFKFKSQTASIELRWVPPHRSEQVIPQRNLLPRSVPSTYVVNTAFPADDSSVGYERGTTVSKAWEQAIALSAVEVANAVVTRLDALSNTKPDAPDRQQKVKAFCSRFVERAFRRPLTQQQREFHVDQFFAEAADVEQAAKRSLMLALVSPHFLYVGIDNARLDDYLVASRLSFGLWDSLPDAALLEAAAKEQLHTPEQVASQARRMLQDPRARAKMRYFLHAWLNIDHLDDVSKDPERFQGFTDTVASSLRTSLDLFLDDVLWTEPSDFRQLLLADYWYVNQPLAQYYSVDGPADEQFVKVQGDEAKVAGILTHPYLMARFAYHRTSSPIHRGVFVVRSLLGRFLKPPPIAVAPADEGTDPSLTTRQRVAQQTKEPTCQTCHSMINSLGFSFEHYDADGRFRDQEREQPIDASGLYKDLEGELVTFRGVRQLAEFLANSPETHRCFLQQLFHNIAKQPVDAYGPDALDQLEKSFAESDFNIQDLLVTIAQTTALGTNKE